MDVVIMGTAENNKTRSNKGYWVIRALGVKAIKEQFDGSNFSMAISCGGLIRPVRRCKTTGPAWRELEMPGGVKGNSVTRDLDRTSTTAPSPPSPTQPCCPRPGGSPPSPHSAGQAGLPEPASSCHKHMTQHCI